MEGLVKYAMVLKKEISLITVFTDPFYFYVFAYVCVFYIYTISPSIPYLFQEELNHQVYNHQQIVT